MPNQTEVDRLQQQLNDAEAANPRDEAKIKSLRDQLATAQNQQSSGQSGGAAGTKSQR